MSNYWTLHVKDFAKIREAKIEAAPLTLFVGDNNSGKSYLLSLLWGLTGGINFGYWTSNKEKNNVVKFDEVQSLLDFWKTRDYGSLSDEPNASAPVNGAKNALPIEATEQRVLADGCNALLAMIKDEIINKIFNTDEMRVESLYLDIPFQDKFGINFLQQNGFALTLTHQPNPMWLQTYMQLSDVNALDFISHYTRFVLGGNIFIPAPRTGFLLTIKTLTQKSLRSAFGRELASGDNLTSPQVSYLEQIAALRQCDLEKMKPSIRGILDYVEQNIICGELKVTKTPLPELRYKPEGFDKTLPLYLSSGVVTEVTGFLSLLKFGQLLPICIYEEPEMCLHPELQWKMARVLVKLVNAGVKVWASTHSDIIIQHVNNMIKLSNHPDGEQLRKDHDYDEDDVISREKVRMYQFNVNPADHKTDVKPLEDGVNGFRIPTFGKVFRELRDEVWNFRIEKRRTLNND